MAAAADYTGSRFADWRIILVLSERHGSAQRAAIPVPDVAGCNRPEPLLQPGPHSTRLVDRGCPGLSAAVCHADSGLSSGTRPVAGPVVRNNTPD